MNLNKLRVSEQVDQQLRVLKARTGLTPNLLCRLGFCLSLEDPTVPNPDLYPEDSSREFNRYTLTGPWDALFVALLKQRCVQDGLPISDSLDDQFRAHLNRGVMQIYKQLRSLEDLSRIVANAQTSVVEQGAEMNG